MVSKEERQAQEICDWILHQIQHTRAQGVVVRISGDVDSAVVACLAQKTLGKNVMGLILPCHDSNENVEDAKLIVNHLGISQKILDLGYSYDGLLHLLPKGNAAINENIKPRLRMLVLYHFAACYNYLVLGTFNKSKWEMGYFTKYGDGAADLYPLLHLLQRDVYDLAAYLKLPRRIIEKPHSTVPWAGEMNEGESGSSHFHLDAFLSGVLEGIPADVATGIRERQQSTLHKRLPAHRLSIENASPEPSAGPPAANDDHEAYDKSIEALALISKAITSDQYLENILRLIVMVTAEVMSSSVCSLWLVDEKEAVLRLRATQSINSEYLKERTLRVGEGIVGKVVAENRPYVVTNVLLEPHFKEKELARRMGLVSMLSMPMRVKDRVIGVINCYTSHPHAFSELQMNVLTAVANQAAVAIENTELMVKTKVIQEELERRKIIERAKDLIMKRFNLSGEDAYRWLQKRSMNTRKSMREVAEAVLLTMES